MPGFRFAVALVVTCSLLGVAGAMAQDAAGTQPTYFALRTTNVQFGKQPEYEAFRKTIRDAAAEMKWPHPLVVLSPIFEDGSIYTEGTLVPDLAPLLGRGPTAAAFEDQPGGAWSALDGVVTGTTVKLYRLRPELSRLISGDLGRFTAWAIINVEVKPFMAPGFEEYMRRWSEAAARADPERAFLTYAPLVNAGSTYRLATPLTNERAVTYAGPPSDLLVLAFGEQEAERVRGLWVEAVNRADYTLMRNRPDLSHYPE